MVRSLKKSPVNSRYSTLGGRIRAARAAFGDAQVDLAQALNCERASVSQWESNVTTPKQAKLEALATRYGLPFEWLAIGKGAAPVLPEPGRARRWPRTGATVLPLTKARTVVELTIGKSPQELGAWQVPTYALDPSTEKPAVYRAPLDLPPTIKAGDYIFVDQAQTAVAISGIWLIKVANLEAMIFARARIAHHKQRKTAIELVCADDMVFDPAATTVIGRAIGRFSSL